MKKDNKDKMIKDSVHYSFKNEMFIQELKDRKVRLSKQGRKDRIMWRTVATLVTISVIVVIGELTGLTSRLIESI